MFRKIRPNNLDKINKLQSMKIHPVGVIGKRDVRINKLISKLYNRKEYYDRPNEVGHRPSTSKK
jgi:hypothetical protein